MARVACRALPECVGTRLTTAATGMFALGRGWAWPATLVALLVALVYLPTHDGSGGGGNGLVAAAAGLYVVGLTVVLPRVVRGGILRLAGSRDPIVLIGRPGDQLSSVEVRPRWRLAAIAAGAVVSLTGAIGGLALTHAAEPASNAHAIASLFLGANAIVAAGALVPLPGYTGWALLLVVIDAAGTPAELRVRRAARMGKGIGFPLFLLVGVGAALLGDPLLMLAAFLLAMLSWTSTDRAVARDHMARFLAGRTAGDVARPVAIHADADDPVAALVTGAGQDRVVAMVELRGAIVGALGPRQLAALDAGRPGQRCSDVMVPIGDVPLLPSDTPAASLMPALGRRGFVLVRMPGAVAFVEATDLLDRILGGDAGREPGGVSP